MNFLETTFNWSYLLIAASVGILIALLVLRKNDYDKSKIQVLSVDDFVNTMRKGTLIDTRKHDIYEQGKILGAKNYPGASGAKDSTVRKDIPIFLYDQTGKSAPNYAKNYAKANAVMVYILKGGYEAFLESKKK